MITGIGMPTSQSRMPRMGNPFVVHIANGAAVDFYPWLGRAALGRAATYGGAA
jgi:hypothetical protein